MWAVFCVPIARTGRGSGQCSCPGQRWRRTCSATPPLTSPPFSVYWGTCRFWHRGIRIRPRLLRWTIGSDEETTVSIGPNEETTVYRAPNEETSVYRGPNEETSVYRGPKLVVEDIPLVGWGLCVGKVCGVISFQFGPVRGCPRMGPQCLLTPPVSASSIYAAVVYVSGG